MDRGGSPSRRPSWPDLLLGAYLVTALVMLVWPGYEALGNRVHPYVLGMPFALFWYVAWIVATPFALLLYDRARRRMDG